MVTDQDSSKTQQEPSFLPQIFFIREFNKTYIINKKLYYLKKPTFLSEKFLFKITDNKNLIIL